MTEFNRDLMLDADSPVETLEIDRKRKSLDDGVGLCLSGGGYRAMLFHVGSLWRLNELGYLKKLDRVSSVSGGSITAGVLGLIWSRLDFDAAGVAAEFQSQLVAPVRGLADRTIDRKAVLFGLFGPGSISSKIAKAYRKHLFGDKTLQDLPVDPPRFVINATNVQSGALWRFMKPYMRDWRVGGISNPTLPLSVAVAASSAFPPILSPAQLDLESSAFDPGSGDGLQREPYTTRVFLTDGGVYDNLGLETVWKKYTTVLVSDGGGKMRPDPNPKRNWICHVLRVLSVIDNQVRSLRKRQTIDSFRKGTRRGAYWGIRTNIDDYGLSNAMQCDFSKTTELADVSTRLKKLDARTQERLINWGYAVCDAAMRRHVEPGLPAPAGFPYPGVGV